MKTDASFWHEIAQLAKTNVIIIDRPKGSAHPRYPQVIYPLDYGYLEKKPQTPDYVTQSLQQAADWIMS